MCKTELLLLLGYLFFKCDMTKFSECCVPNLISPAIKPQDFYCAVLHNVVDLGNIMWHDSRADYIPHCHSEDIPCIRATGWSSSRSGHLDHPKHCFVLLPLALVFVAARDCTSVPIPSSRISKLCLSLCSREPRLGYNIAH